MEPVTDTVEVYKSKNGEYSWRRISANRRIVATAGETYVHHGWATTAAKTFNRDVPEENFKDIADA